MQAALRELAETYRRAAEALAPIAGECRGCGESGRPPAGFCLNPPLSERTNLVR